MLISIAQDNGEFVSIDVDVNEEVENVKALIEVQLGIPLAEQILLRDGKELKNTDRLQALNVNEGDVLLVRRRSGPARGAGRGGMPVSEEGQFDLVRQQIRASQQVQAQLRQQNPRLLEAALAPDATQFYQLMRQEAQRRAQAEAQRAAQDALLDADPFNPEHQKLIEQRIHQQNVQENMEQAMEHTPEAFARVTMLYIDIEVNGHAIKAFVDSGAQSTIMSEECAERCNIKRLIDTRFASHAKGVGGLQKILGRVHMAPIKIGKNFFPQSYTILQGRDMEFLLGLDFLRRHQAVLDLRANVLRIGEDTVVPFLSEGQLPSHLRDEGSGPGKEPAPATPSAAPPAASAAASSFQGGSGALGRASAAVPAAAAAAAGSGARARSQSPGKQYPAETVKKLTDLGFSERDARRALVATNGDVEAAASLLFSSF